MIRNWYGKPLQRMNRRRAHTNRSFDYFSLQLIKTAVERIGRADAPIFWNFLLGGFKSNSDAATTKRFTVIMAVLNQINKFEVTAKQCFELITRLFIELPKLSGAQLIELSQYCVESLRTGDPKCTGWILNTYFFFVSIAIIIIFVSTDGRIYFPKWSNC